MRISDWSSDVCSSDLLAPPHAAELYGLTLHGTGMEDADHNMTRFVVLAREPLADLTAIPGPLMTTFMFEVKNIPAALRSEERRVGKECISPWRSRWSP